MFVSGALGGLLLFGNVPLCPVAIVARMPCPGCGMTRATRALLRGHIAESFHWHPLVLPVAPLMVAWVLLGAWRYFREGRFRSFEENPSRAATVVAGVLGVLAFAVWLARFFGAFGGPVPV